MTHRTQIDTDYLGRLRARKQRKTEKPREELVNLIQRPHQMGAVVAKKSKTAEHKSKETRKQKHQEDNPPK